ncbi:hypothetical protein [Vannielia litorea]|nr:hypothetical protein [Vannielia litorea]
MNKPETSFKPPAQLHNLKQKFASILPQNPGSRALIAAAGRHC